MKNLVVGTAILCAIAASARAETITISVDPSAKTVDPGKGPNTFWLDFHVIADAPSISIQAMDFGFSILPKQGSGPSPTITDVRLRGDGWLFMTSDSEAPTISYNAEHTQAYREVDTGTPKPIPVTSTMLAQVQIAVDPMAGNSAWIFDISGGNGYATRFTDGNGDYYPTGLYAFQGGTLSLVPEPATLVYLLGLLVGMVALRIVRRRGKM